MRSSIPRVATTRSSRSSWTKTTKTSCGQRMHCSWRGTAATSCPASIVSIIMPRPFVKWLWAILRVRSATFSTGTVLTHLTLIVKQVFYPKYVQSKVFYDACRSPNGGYGGLVSITFHSLDDAIVFYDSLGTAKGPSLGTNFSLSCPYTLIAHYNELEWVGSPVIVIYTHG